MSAEKVSIILLNMNEVKLTLACINSIYEFTPKSEFEIILIDQNSDKYNIKELKKIERKYSSNLKVIYLDYNSGFSGGNNIGVENARYDFILFLNNDTEVIHKNWLNQLVKPFFENEKVGIVGCKLIFPNKKVQHCGFIIKDSAVAVDLLEGDSRNVDFVTGACLLIKKEFLENNFAFDNNFNPAYFEDTDLCERIRKRGFFVYYSNETILVHKLNATTKKFISSKKYFMMNKNRIRFVLLNWNKIKLIKLIPFEIFRFFKSIFQFRVQYFLKAWILNLKSIKEIRQKRRLRFEGKTSL